MFPIPGTFLAAIKSYWGLATTVMQKIKFRQSVLSLVMNIISINQIRHVNTPVEAVVVVAREARARVAMESGSVTRTIITEIIIMEKVINFETVIKRG